MPSNFKKDWYDIIIIMHFFTCFGMRVIGWIMVPIMCPPLLMISAIIGHVTSVCNVYVNYYYVQSWLGLVWLGKLSLSSIYLNNNGMSGSYRFYSLRDSMALI